MSDIHIYSEGVVSISVCAPMGIDQTIVEKEVNLLAPTGLGNGWKVTQSTFATGEPNPHPCEGNSGRNHWLLNC